jgi:hypothetical protein
VVVVAVLVVVNGRRIGAAPDKNAVSTSARRRTSPSNVER